MIAAHRRALILEQLRRERAASIVALSDTVGVSPTTIRRDLDFLTQGGYIVRSHGGAVLNEHPRTTFEPQREIGARIAYAAKAAIGTRAADLLEAGQSVIFDSSSTVLEAARAVVARNIRLTVCTNDIGTAAVLADSQSLHLVVLGGTNRFGSLTMIGDPGLSFLERIHADVAFIGIHSLFGQRLSETSIDLAAMKRRMIASATRAIVLADSSKFRHPAFCDVARVTEISTILTDTGIGESDRDALTEAGVEIIEVEPAALPDH
ncbi:MAG: DeoR/GlpR transcriptional regulator [Rhizobiales bacterium]|nr:DeoR/GlpR transcriptional regulator [Hyphomicrobiales bacterium]MDQ3560085.1 DeoR/GlpR family DNA-binding transcription regulator [Pseudomonadota bacterium]